MLMEMNSLAAYLQLQVVWVYTTTILLLPIVKRGTTELSCQKKSHHQNVNSTEKSCCSMLS
ncbi:Uncharacterised protein [Vibrio metschnikovii]|nr:Uncharacterised protein [Vibrio metschnikovii]SUP50995.1 Uncharacterised protein [Vibrio metschnikovii]